MTPLLTPLPSQLYLRKGLQHLNMKSEADSRQAFEKWPVSSIDKNYLVAMGLHYTNVCILWSVNRPL